LIFDKQCKAWRFLWWIDGKRKSKIIGTKEEFTERDAWRRVEELKLTPETKTKATLGELVQRFETERFPQRQNTAKVYRSWLKNHIKPMWGDQPLTAIQPQAVESWLRSLDLAPKSKTHVRALMHALFEFAMFAGAIELGRNPISLVRNHGATHRIRQVRNLTVAEFQRLVKELPEPFATLALCCGCLGLRISEALGLKWGDVDWLGSSISIQRSIVGQVVDTPKTQGSRKSVIVADELLERLRGWKQCSEFASESDWVFASSVQLGLQPYSYTGVVRIFRRAAAKAGIGKIATHTFRHSFRSWLGASGIPLGVQKELMRHSTIGMTLCYGQTFDPQLKAASDTVADLIFASGSDADHSAS
jgi:integrase